MSKESSCPVRHASAESGGATDSMGSSGWFWFSSAVASKQQASPTTNLPSGASSEEQSSCPVMATPTAQTTSSGGGGGAAVPPFGVASVEEAAKYAQTPQADQRFPLQTHRQVSSIPRSISAGMAQAPVPHHQPNLDKDKDDSFWVYPSEQQLLNAMRRKGWKDVPEDSIPIVLQIHNNVNERTWNQVVEWENSMVPGGGKSGAAPRLVRFEGRPKDLTPKAFFMSRVLHWYEAPFDRHDWYVAPANDKSKGENVQRYVIDFYMMPSEDATQKGLMVPRVDARPALDGPRAVAMHMKRFASDAFPGISSFLSRQYQQYAMQSQQHLSQQQGKQPQNDA